MFKKYLNAGGGGEFQVAVEAMAGALRSNILNARDG
jgi:hypothetical protein